MSISTGVSLEEEISGSSNTDVKIVVLSYLLMFFYASLALGVAEVAERDVQAIDSIEEEMETRTTGDQEQA